MDNDTLSNLIQTYLRAKSSGELGDETRYHDKIESYRTWLRENILDQNKLSKYTNQEFAAKFAEMYDHTDGHTSDSVLIPHIFPPHTTPELHRIRPTKHF